MKTIDLRLLVELKDDDDDKEFKLLNKFTFKSSPSKGSPLSAIRSFKSKAAKKPKELLKELGISSSAGKNEYEVVFNAIKQAIDSNKTFATFFPEIEFNTEAGDGVVIITPTASRFNSEDKNIGDLKHPDVYIAAIVLALQKTGAISNEISSEPKQINPRIKRHIIQADGGHIIITNPKNLNPKSNIT